MSCCGVKIEKSRNEDIRITYTPNDGFSFSTFTARMQVREYEGAPDPALLDITMSATPNGSVFSVYGSSLVLTIEQADLEGLPVADPVSDPLALVYDVVVTDATGFSTNLVSGPFILREGVTR